MCVGLHLYRPMRQNVRSLDNILYDNVLYCGSEPFAPYGLCLGFNTHCTNTEWALRFIIHLYPQDVKPCNKHVQEVKCRIASTLLLSKSKPTLANNHDSVVYYNLYRLQTLCSIWFHTTDFSSDCRSDQLFTCYRLPQNNQLEPAKKLIIIQSLGRHFVLWF